MKEKSLRNLKNYLFWQPYYHCIVTSLLCLEDGRFSSVEKFRALEEATLADFRSFASSMVKTLKAQVLVHGNITAEETALLTAKISENLPFKTLPSSQAPVRRVVQLEESAGYVFRQHAALNNPNEVNSAVENIYMVGLSDGATKQCARPQATSPAVVNEATLELLAHMVRSLYCMFVS
jgi:secreted Zn-dependent insulinase-like peptidase